MGLFNRKSMHQRQDDAMKMAENIGQGRGFVGKMTKAVMGSEFTEQLQGATGSYRQAEYTAQLRQSGIPTETVSVLSVQDTGQTINENPHIILHLEVDGGPTAIATLVSRLEIPRTGDQILVMRDPQSGNLLYAGLAPRS